MTSDLNLARWFTVTLSESSSKVKGQGHKRKNKSPATATRRSWLHSRPALATMFS